MVLARSLINTRAVGRDQKGYHVTRGGLGFPVLQGISFHE
jgi:hypothetical protein